jgi:hypothetical protein
MAAGGGMLAVLPAVTAAVEVVAMAELLLNQLLLFQCPKCFSGFY